MAETNETLEYIDAYFEKKLSNDEKQTFEQRCHQDENFAGEVAFYVTAREALRQKLLEKKQQLWSDNEYDADTQAAFKPSPVRKMYVKRWLAYAAAACLVFSLAVYFLHPSATPRMLADNYVEQKREQLSQTMDGSTDSLQKGISFVKNGAYDSALGLFKPLSRQPENDEAKEYLGFTYLLKKDYDKALVEFDELANKKLFSNPGIFMKAVTLLQRNKTGDKEAAKMLLEQVREQQLEGKREADQWLRKW